MYINKIDDIIDKILDDFYTNTFIKQNNDKILSEINFVKYQKEINNNFINYNKTINVNEIREIIKNEDNIVTILEIIKRYIAYYLFLYIGGYYLGTLDNFTNNILEFAKNQIDYKYKIPNFFNSENNSILINYFIMIRNIIFILGVEESKLPQIIKKIEMKSTIEFLNTLGQEFIDISFKLENLKNNKSLQMHNIIKTIIIMELYKKNEKKNVFNILDSVEKEEGEYTFIEIVIPKKKYIDYTAVVNILTKREIIKDLANEFWNYIVENVETIVVTQESIDKKILTLINSGIIIPIVDDFLLYHKDTEKYDKTIDIDKIKKKEDTKIKYIINKIDSTTDYYTAKDDKLVNIKKNFFPPLYDRKAILVNNNEELKIISKYLNIGKKSIENVDYFNDLMHYRTYPYINFNDFGKYNGFGLNLDKTIDIVRSVSFEQNGDFKQNIRNPIQMRIGSKDQNINIVGFIIPTNKQNVNCLKVRDFVNIKSLDKNNNNGYNLMLNYIKKSSIQKKQHDASVYWLFDLETDNVLIDTYEQENKLTQAEQIKLIINKLYDDLLNEIYFKIVEKFEKKGKLEIQTALKYLNYIENKTLFFPRKSDIYNDLENEIFFKNSIKIEPSYDQKEDIFYGIIGDIIKLKHAPPPKTPRIQTIKINTITHNENKNKNIDDIEFSEGICQHNITWEYITTLRKKNPGKYSNILYEFIQQYVIENNNQDFVCKSCSTLLNIKKYIIDGEYDNDTQRFVTYSMPMEVPLEDIPEYEKYKSSIRNIDKLVERIAIISNIPYFIGSTLSVKWRRKTVIKDVIDLLLINNSILKKNFKERNELSTKLYNISRDLSNLFIFELDNDIFKFSSKEKDYYKPIKQNNILSYLIIFVILEINESQLSFMTGDKKGICNFPVFDKYGYVIFDNLKIRKNREGDIDNLGNYKVLCYILYIISCMVTKYNMWFFEIEDTKNKKFNPIVQKSIVHTVIDLLNSIIENSKTNDNHHIYEIVTTRFFKKLNSMYNNDELIKKLRILSIENTSTNLNKKIDVINKNDIINLVGKYIPHKFELSNYIFCRLPKYYLPSKVDIYQKFYNINNITNCPQGSFHIWKLKDKDFVCEICNTNLNNLKLNDKLTEEIYINFKYSRLNKLTLKYCINGSLHNFMLNDKLKNVCNKCNKEENYKYSKSDLDKLEDNLNNFKNKLNNNINKLIEKENELIYTDNLYKKKVLDNLVDLYKKSITKDNMYKYIDDFIDNIQSISGTEIGNSNDNVYLKDNIYIVDHDYLGHLYETPIIITDKNNIIKFKQNHTFFNTDVLYYTNTKISKIDVFYDATSLILLGYKEISKDFVLSIKPDKKLKINYSIYNKLKILGYESKFIQLKDKLNELIDKYVGLQINNDLILNKDDIFKILIKDFIRSRLSNLKKVIYEFQRFLFRIKNNYNVDSKNKDNLDLDKKNGLDEDEINIIEVITNKYSKKLLNMNVYDNNRKHKIFKHWKAVVSQLQADDLSDINFNIDIDAHLLNSEDINKYDYNGNLLLFYIITEINKLINFNSNKVLKSNIINFLIEFINIMFDMFNIESRMHNQEIKRFIMSLNSSLYLLDNENLISGESVGIYQEYKDVDDKDNPDDIENNIDDMEEADALDIDNDLDNGDDIYEDGSMNWTYQYAKTYEDKEINYHINTFWEPLIVNPYD